jgi:hypothetical protein
MFLVKYDPFIKGGMLMEDSSRNDGVGYGT